jgi:hypothetical protein
VSGARANDQEETRRLRPGPVRLFDEPRVTDTTGTHATLMAQLHIWGAVTSH